MGDSLLSIISEIHKADYKLEGELKERVISVLSVRARGARVIHPVFGIGTVGTILGNYYITVKFDRDRPKDSHYYHFSRNVATHKLLSLDMLVQKEIDKREAEKNQVIH